MPGSGSGSDSKSSGSGCVSSSPNCAPDCPDAGDAQRQSRRHLDSGVTPSAISPNVMLGLDESSSRAGSPATSLRSRSRVSSSLDSRGRGGAAHRLLRRWNLRLRLGLRHYRASLRLGLRQGRVTQLPQLAIIAYSCIPNLKPRHIHIWETWRLTTGKSQTTKQRSRPSVAPSRTRLSA